MSETHKKIKKCASQLGLTHMFIIPITIIAVMHCIGVPKTPLSEVAFY